MEKIDRVPVTGFIFDPAPIIKDSLDLRGSLTGHPTGYFYK